MAQTSRSLQEYRRKRVPTQTPEPFGDEHDIPGGGATGGAFVVHQHAARRMHWDLRLAIGGVLVSWAVPRGPSLDPKEKRLAVQTEDHPLEYGDFEGIIPPGNYGAGATIVWDRGTYRTVDGQAAAVGWSRGKLDVELRGHKLRGRWALIRTKGDGGKNWLLLSKATTPSPGPEIVVSQPASVFSGLTVEELGAGVRRTAALAAEAGAAGAIHRALDAARLQPMLAGSADAAFSKTGWIFELKYDGVRALVERQRDGRVRVFSRTQHDLTATFPEVARAVRLLPCDEFLLDAEIAALDERGVSSFELLQRRLGLNEPSAVARGEVETPVVLYCFDLLSVAGWDVRALALSARKQLLRQLVPAIGVARYSEHFDTEGERMFQAASDLGFEGVVAKRAGSPYVCGRRSRDWLKIKAVQEADVVIVGYLRGRGGRARLGSIMAAWIRDGQLVYAGNVGSGFDGATLDELLRQLAPLRRGQPAFVGRPAGARRDQVFVEPHLVATVRYAGVTDAGVLRHPVFVRLRDDKPPDECAAPAARNVEPMLAAAAAPEPAVVEKHLRLSNLDKVFWPAEGYTKGDLLAYYESIWPLMAPYLQDRPVVLTRYPDGIEGKSFFQKNAPGFTPEWVHTEHIDDTDYFICNDCDTLLYVINSGCIPVHVWSARLASIERPDWAILDLDPKGAPFEHVLALARHVDALLGRLDVPHFAKTSGQEGLHVLIPLAQALTHAEARAFAEVLARVVAAARPDIATVARPLTERGGKVYVDFLQNGFGKTIVAPFSVRPRPGAPVSTPLAWREVNARLEPQRLNIDTVPQRFRRRADPMRAVLGPGADIGKALERLSEQLHDLGTKHHPA
jgi:bifunctional non-homologous end joining protein LigD